VWRIIRVALILVGVLIVLAALGLLGIRYASRYEPAFYQEALNLDRDTLEKGSDRMIHQATALANAVRKPGHWKFLFTAEQINGWMAVDMAKNHPRALPSNLHDPRVAIDAQQITIACRLEQPGVNSVLSLTIEPYVPEPNTIALRIVKARAGLLPMPLSKICDGLSNAANGSTVQLQWKLADGDPVAMLSFPQTDGSRSVEIESLQLANGEILITGTTHAK
jgi:hypothetical protein